MTGQKRTVLVTGIVGTLGTSLLSQLRDFDIVGADITPPVTVQPVRFYPIDLGREESCQSMVELLRETGASAVVHLAFDMSGAPLRKHAAQAGGSFGDHSRVWQTNVAGTARVMEAVAEINRSGGNVRKIVFLSSADVYGPRPAAQGGRRRSPSIVQLATEETQLQAHGLLHAAYQRQADKAVRFWAGQLGVCCTYILRSQTFANATAQNHLLAALRGTPAGRNRMARSWRKKGRRLPLMLPLGAKHLGAAMQVVHVEDVARLVAWILRRSARDPQLTTLNVAARGDAVALQDCVRIAGQRVLKLPGLWTCSAVLRALGKCGMSSIPAEALPYLLNAPLLDTTRLRSLLDGDYSEVIRYNSEEALYDSFLAMEANAERVEALADA
jgi:nucleoside-diphosphate-sugar epimerase